MPDSSDFATVSAILLFICELLGLSSEPIIDPCEGIVGFRRMLEKMISKLPNSVKFLLRLSIQRTAKCLGDSCENAALVTSTKTSFTLKLKMRFGILDQIIDNKRDSPVQFNCEHDTQSNTVFKTSKFIILENSSSDSHNLLLNLRESIRIADKTYKIAGLVMQNDEVVKVVKASEFDGGEREFVEAHWDWHYLYVILMKSGTVH